MLTPGWANSPGQSVSAHWGDIDIRGQLTYQNPIEEQYLLPDHILGVTSKFRWLQL